MQAGNGLCFWRVVIGSSNAEMPACLRGGVLCAFVLFYAHLCFFWPILAHLRKSTVFTFEASASNSSVFVLFCVIFRQFLLRGFCLFFFAPLIARG